MATELTTTQKLDALVRLRFLLPNHRPDECPGYCGFKSKDYRRLTMLILGQRAEITISKPVESGKFLVRPQDLDQETQTDLLKTVNDHLKRAAPCYMYIAEKFYSGYASKMFISDADHDVSAWIYFCIGGVDFIHVFHAYARFSFEPDYYPKMAGIIQHFERNPDFLEFTDKIKGTSVSAKWVNYARDGYYDIAEIYADILANCPGYVKIPKPKSPKDQGISFTSRCGSHTGIATFGQALELLKDVLKVEKDAAEAEAEIEKLNARCADDVPEEKIKIEKTSPKRK